VIYCSGIETTVKKQGNFLVAKNGGPFDYHVDLNNVFRLVDGSNQLMALATRMVDANPKSIFDIGLGLGCLPRFFLHHDSSLQVDSTDLDYRVIESWGKIFREYFQDQVTEQEVSRHVIMPSDGAELIGTIFAVTIFDVIWLDILDDNYKSDKNLLFNTTFLGQLRGRVDDEKKKKINMEELLLV